MQDPNIIPSPSSVVFAPTSTVTPASVSPTQSNVVSSSSAATHSKTIVGYYAVSREFNSFTLVEYISTYLTFLSKLAELAMV